MVFIQHCFHIEQHWFHLDRQFSCSPNISNWLSRVPTQSSLVIHNSCFSWLSRTLSDPIFNRLVWSARDEEGWGISVVDSISIPLEYKPCITKEKANIWRRLKNKLHSSLSLSISVDFRIMRQWWWITRSVIQQRVSKWIYKEIISNLSLSNVTLEGLKLMKKHILCYLCTFLMDNYSGRIAII